METGQLVTDIIKSGVATVVVSRISKAIGEKDIADIITGAGLTVVGVDILLLTIPTCNKIMDFLNSVGAVADKFRKVFEGLGFFK